MRCAWLVSLEDGGVPTNAMQPGPDNCSACCINVRSVNDGDFAVVHRVLVLEATQSVD